jgi:RNA polymerase sigma factor (TIGR02999 family)
MWGVQMSEPGRHNITQILLDLQSDRVSHRAAADQLFQVVYGELRRLASGLMRGERADHTLQSTALVHEVYLRLVDDSRVHWQNRAHFFGTAARAMRQILVDFARKRATDKRGGDWQRVTLDGAVGLEEASASELLDLEEALRRLAEHDERMARIVELRVFGGLTAKEVAHVIGMSRQTVQDDWRVAKMWLRHQLANGGVS